MPRWTAEQERLIRGEWGEELRPCPAGELEDWDLDEGTAAFLREVGLPDTATDGGNLTLRFRRPAEYEERVYHGRRYLVVGETDVDEPVLVRLPGGLVFVGDETGRMFMNASLAALLSGMTTYHREFCDRPLTPEEEDVTLTEDDEVGTPATRARARRLRKRLRSLGPRALDVRLNEGPDDVTLWGFVVEETESGVI